MDSEFKFYLTRGANEVQVTPGNFAEIKFEHKAPVPSCKSLRKTMTGSLLVTDKAISGEESPYQWLYAIKESNERTSEIKLRVEELKNGSYSVVYNGFFTIASCKIDESRRTVEINQEPDDKYRLILKKFNDEFNFLDAPIPVADPIIDFHTFRFDDPSSQQHESWFDFNTSVTENVQPDNSKVIGIIDSEEGDYSNVLIYAREEVQIEPGQFDTVNDELTGWSRMTTNGLEYERPPVIDFFLPDFKIIRSANIGSHAGYEAVFTWTDGSIGGGTEFNLLWQVHQHKSDGTIPNTRKLTDSLKYIIGLIDSDIEPSIASSISDFFSLDNNYIGDVTNLYKDVRLSQITDVKTPSATAPANNGLIKPKEFLEDLNQLGFYWFINDSGNFQLEHLYYFDNLTNSNDLTTSVYSPYTQFLNSYEYLKEEIPSREVWKLSSGSRNDESGNFFEVEMNYSAIDRRNDEGEELTHEIRTLCLDVRDAMRDPVKYRNNLTCLLAVDDAGKIHRAEDDSSRYYNLNYPFDLDKLVGINKEGDDTGVNIIPFLQYGRYGTSATLSKYSGSSDGNSLSVTNQSLLRRKKQVEIIIPNFKTVSFDFIGKWETGVSDQGQVETASENIYNGTITIQIIHPEESGQSSPLYPIVPVYPVDGSSDNVCTSSVMYAEKTSQGYVIVTSSGFGIKIVE